MTNQEKAKDFLKFWIDSDPRCHVVLMMLSVACQITEQECLKRIESIAGE